MERECKTEQNSSGAPQHRSRFQFWTVKDQLSRLKSGKRFTVVLCCGLLIVVFFAVFSKKSSSPFLPPSSQYIKHKDANTVIIFVHGIFGDSQQTWANGRTSFPQLLAEDKSLGLVDVYVQAYNSPVFNRATSIPNLVESLRRDLDNDHVISDHRNLVFLCHSMGGLIVRDLLLEYKDKGYADKTRMVYFFGTPTEGSELAKIAKILSKNRQSRDLMPFADNSYLESLQNRWLASVYPKQIDSYCGIEELPTYGLQIVTRESATNLCNKPLDPIPTDHIDLVKPSSRESASYKAFKTAFFDSRSHWQPNDFLPILGGVVSDANGFPIPGVRIMLPTYHQETKTDKMGRFDLHVEAAEQVRVDLKAEKPGFKRLDASPTLGDTSFNFQLNHTHR